MSGIFERTPGRFAWLPGLMLLLPAGFAATLTAPTAVSAQQGATSHHLKTTRTAGRYQQGGKYRGSNAQQRIEAHRNRHADRLLVSPVGGAANVRPDFYLQLGVGDGHTVYTAPPRYQKRYGHSRHYASPYVVYIDDHATEPQIYGEPPTYETYAEPTPQPIYIVQQPPQVIQVPAPAAPAPEPEVSPPPAPQPPTAPRSTEPQGFSLSVHPADARVYLDDEPMGTASEATARLSSLDPGIYVLEILHDDFSPQRLVFGVSSEPVAITIDLTADRPGRRARVK